MRKNLFQNRGIRHLDLNVLLDARKDDELKDWRSVIISEVGTWQNMRVCHRILKSIDTLINSTHTIPSEKYACKENTRGPMVL